MYGESKDTALPVSCSLLVSLLEGQVVRSAGGSIGGGLEKLWSSQGGSIVILSWRKTSGLRVLFCEPASPRAPGHKVPVTDFSKIFPLLFKPVKAFLLLQYPAQKSTSSEKPPGSKLSHSPFCSLHSAFGVYLKQLLIFALHSSHFFICWSLPIASKLVEQSPCLHLYIFRCPLKTDIVHMRIVGMGGHSDNSGAYLSFSLRHSHCITFCPLLLLSRVIRMMKAMDVGTCHVHCRWRSLWQICEEQRSSWSHLWAEYVVMDPVWRITVVTISWELACARHGPKCFTYIV